MQFPVRLMYFIKLLQEPTVNLCQFMNLIDGVTCIECLFNNKDTLVGRLFQSLVHIVNLEFLVVNKTVHALANHAQALLDNLLKGATDGHNLANRLH